jgi:hypothetical protein
MPAKKKPITVGKGTSYTRPVTPGSKPRPVSAKPSQASKVRAAKKTTSDRGRAGRQSISKAQVTQSGGGKPGSAKVTTGRGVTAAQKQGQQIRKAAESKRGAKKAMQRMGTKLAQAQALRNVARGGKAGIMAAAVKESITSRNTADGTLTAAMKRGDYKPKQGPSPKTTQSSFNKKSFNEAFRQARKSGTSTFTWRGKKYTTKKKGE